MAGGYTKRIPINDPDIRLQMRVVSENLDYLWAELQGITSGISTNKNNIAELQTKLAQSVSSVYGHTSPMEDIGGKNRDHDRRYWTKSALAGMGIGPGVLVAGGVLFGGPAGTIAQDAPNFYWDDAANELGILTNNPLSTIDARGSIRGNYDTDTTSYFGRAAVGFNTADADTASFAHIDCNTAANYCLKQNSTGETSINAATGQYIYLCENSIRLGNIQGAVDGAGRAGYILVFNGAGVEEIRFDGRAAGGTGSITCQQQVTAAYFSSTVLAPTPPFACNSIIVCANLNADLLDGVHAASFAPAAHALLSATHSDTTASAVATGDIVCGIAGAWDNLAMPAVGYVFCSTGVGTAPSWTVAYDTDYTGTIGRAKIGFAVTADVATFSHFDHNTATNYGVKIDASAKTSINSATGQSTSFNINNTQIGYVNATGIWGNTFAVGNGGYVPTAYIGINSYMNLTDVAGDPIADRALMVWTPTINVANIEYGADFAARLDGTANVGGITGGRFFAYLYQGSGTTGNVTCGYFALQTDTTSRSMTNFYGMRFDVAKVGVTIPTATTAYQLYLGDYTTVLTAVTKWGIYQRGTALENYFENRLTIGGPTTRTPVGVVGDFFCTTAGNPIVLSLTGGSYADGAGPVLLFQHYYNAANPSWRLGSIAGLEEDTGHAPWWQGSLGFYVNDTGALLTTQTLVWKMSGKSGHLQGYFDNQYVKVGAGQDAGIMYDGTDMIVCPALVGTGMVKIGESGTPTTYFASDYQGNTFWVGDGSGIPYGSCYGNHIAWTQADMAQNTWYNISDADMSDGTGGLNLVTHDGSGKLTVTKAGRYKIEYALTFLDDTANNHIETGIEISGSGSAVNDGQGHLENKFASEEEFCGGCLILDLAASATIEVCIRTTDATTPDIEVQMVNLVVTMCGGT